MHGVSVHDMCYSALYLLLQTLRSQEDVRAEDAFGDERRSFL